MSEPDSEPASAPSVPGSSAGAAGSAGTRKWVVFLIVAVLSLIADQATKIWARESLPTSRYDHGTATCIVPDDLMARRDQAGTEHLPMCHGDNRAVLDDVWHWRLSMNPGSAFGLFST